MAAKMAAELSKRQVAVPAIPIDEDNFTGAPTTIFSASEQFVSNSGAHAYVAPNFGAGDIRGPCPGLNALANHNYIAHNGVTNLLEAISGTTKGFGMGNDLAGFLSAYSVIQDGDPLTTQWSIGGSPGGSLLGLTGAPQGLTGSHNKYETDSSPTRGDLYEFCNNFEVQLNQFQELYDLHRGEPDSAVTYSFEDLSGFRSTRFDESVSRNPNFFYGPFSGLVVSQAAFTFIPAFMSNHSAEYPNGILSRSTLKSFFGIVETGGTGKGDGKLTYNPGTEKIPNNWYRRSSANPYSIPYFIADSIRIYSTYPKIASIGGNTNGVNTFSGLDFGNITGGVYSAQSLTDPTKLQCFTFQLVQQGIQDATKGVVANLVTAVNSLVGKYISPATNGLGCPTLAAIQPTVFTNSYPGAQGTSACK